MPTRPNYQAKDLAPPEFERALQPSLRSRSRRTEPGHIVGAVERAARSSRPTTAAALRGAAARQRGDPRRRNDEGRVQPDGFRGGDGALHAQPRADQDSRSAEPEREREEERRHGFHQIAAIAASGLRAQTGRMRIISENIANANSTAQAPGGDPYRRKIVDVQFRARSLARRQVVKLGRVAHRQIRIFWSSTSPAIRPPTPTATSNIRTSTRWSK